MAGNVECGWGVGSGGWVQRRLGRKKRSSVKTARSSSPARCDRFIFPKDIEWLPVVHILLAGSVVGVLNMLKLAPPESSLPRGMIYVVSTFKCSFLSLSLSLWLISGSCALELQFTLQLQVPHSWEGRGVAPPLPAAWPTFASWKKLWNTRA